MHMSPRKVNMHLEALSNINLIQVEYFPGERGPIRQVWLTNPEADKPREDIPVPKNDYSSGRSRRRKIKNKVAEILD
jgi:hypothetical protein